MAFSKPDAPSTMTSSGTAKPTGQQVVEENPPGGLAFAAHVAQGDQYFLAVTTNAQRHQHRKAGRLPVQANPDNRTVENQADDVVPGKIALLPGLPVGLHLAPGPAHGVLANRPAEQRCQGAPDPSRVGASQIGAGDQPFGLHRQALVGRQRLAAPLRWLAIAVGHPCPRNRHR